jgi:hypothetical protein
MTQFKVDNIADAAGTGAPDFADGLTVAGSAISTLNTAEYYETGTEPLSPKNGAIWKDTANDQLMIYVAGEFNEIELGAAAASGWTVDLANVTYDNVSFSFAGQEDVSTEVAFSSDGTKMYVVGVISDRVHQYTLSTGFDLSTASYDNVSFSVAGQDIRPHSITVNSDGTKMYIVGNSTGRVHQYTLSTGFDVSTASYDNVSFSIAAQESNVTKAVLSTDGTKMYVVGADTDSVFQYTLATGFDVSTASYDNVSFNVSGQETNPNAIFFNPEGTKMYMTGNISDRVYQYTLSSGFDLSTASYDNVSFSVAGQESHPTGLFFSTTGTKMFIVGAVNDTVYQYSTGL